RVVPPQSDHSPPRSRKRRRRVSRPEPPRRARDAPHDPGQRRHRDSPLQRVRGGGPLRPGPPARRDSDHHGAVTLLLLIAALQADSASFAIRDFPFASGETLPVLRLHYLTLGRLRRDAGGSARNAVLILHGTGGSGSQFLSPLFAGELYGPGQPLDTTTHYLILPDNLGHGRSSKPSGLLAALQLLFMMSSSPLQLQRTASTRDSADAYITRWLRERLAETDANDMAYQFEASRDYDPRPDLERITVPVLAINSADD